MQYACRLKKRVSELNFAVLLNRCVEILTESGEIPHVLEKWKKRYRLFYPSSRNFIKNTSALLRVQSGSIHEFAGAPI